MKIKATTQAEVAERTAREEQQRLNDEARAELRSTDWYALREWETGKAMPAEIRARRQQLWATVEQQSEIEEDQRVD